MEKNELLILVIIWMNIKIIMLNENPDKAEYILHDSSYIKFSGMEINISRQQISSCLGLAGDGVERYRR